jgi:hypothetical protein
MESETRLILDNIGEAVITHSDKGINYVNQAGLKILTSGMHHHSKDMVSELNDEL